MAVALLTDRLRRWGDQPAIATAGGTVSYAELRGLIDAARERLDAAGVESGSVVALLGDFGPDAIAVEFALFEMGCVVAPLRREGETRLDQLCRIAEAEWVITVPAGEEPPEVVRTGTQAANPLFDELKAERRPGLILFSSGTSSGEPKAALHDMDQLLTKFERPARPSSMLAFLLFDHVGGVNTMLHALLHGGCLVTVEGRNPDLVAAVIERHRVELLPTTPTFLNLLLLSGADQRHDLSSLRVISYGSEPMTESTLKTLRARLPEARLHQTYGMTEFGIPVSKSRASDSLWIKFVGEDCDFRVRNGILELRARTTMLGYLNAPSPFAADGWLITGDAVEVDGDWIHVLGRRSELINVGGEKVVPAEVESVIEELDGVEEVVVGARPSPLTGQLVCATVRVSGEEPLVELRRRLRRHCRERLPRHMVPQKVVLADRPIRSDRYKKSRASTETEQSA